MKKEKVLLLAQQLLHTAAPVSPGLFGSNFPLLDWAKTVAIISRLLLGCTIRGHLRTNSNVSLQCNILSKWLSKLLNLEGQMTSPRAYQYLVVVR